MLLLFVAARETHAGSGAGPISRGVRIDHVVDLDPIAAAAVAQQVGPGATIGYRYSTLNLFSFEIWNRDGKFVLHRGDKVWIRRQPAVARVLGIPSVDELSRPWRYNFPPALIVLVIAVAMFSVVGVRVLRALRSRG